MSLGPFYYIVEKLDGDYAHLRRTDIDSEDLMLVARALLPPDTNEESQLKWEDLAYELLE